MYNEKYDALYLNDIIHKFLTYKCIYISPINLKVVNFRTGKKYIKNILLSSFVLQKADIKSDFISKKIDKVFRVYVLTMLTS